GEDPNSFNSPVPVALPNVVYEVHMYLPHDYTGQGLDGDSTHPVSYPGIGTLNTSLNKVRNFQNNYPVRIFVGEFSVVRYAPSASSYLHDCISIFEGYGWSWCYHAYREAKVWSLEVADQPFSSQPKQLSPPTDRYNEVVGGGLILNQ